VGQVLTCQPMGFDFWQVGNLPHVDLTTRWRYY